MTVRDEVDQARYVAERVLEQREAGIALKAQAVLFRASHHSGPLEIELTRRNIPFVKFGGLKFLEAAHVKDVLAFLRWAENPRDRVAGFRVVQLLPGVGPATAGATSRSVMAERAIRSQAVAAFVAPPAAAAHWPAFVARGRASCTARPPAGRPSSTCVCRWYEPHLERIHDDAAMRQADLLQLAQIASSYPTPRALPDRAHARSARRHQRRSRDAAARRGLSDPLDHPLRQGPGVEIGPRAQRDRRLHPVRPRHRQQGGDRGGAAPALRRDDPRQGSAAPGHAAALLRAPAEEQRRPPHVCRADALHHRRHARPLRELCLADRRRGDGRQQVDRRAPSTSPCACAACGVEHEIRRSRSGPCQDPLPR